MTRQKAAAMAQLYIGAMAPSKLGSENKAAEMPKEITSTSYYIEKGDTLLWAFNFGDEAGFAIVAADCNTFPVVACSESGSVTFDGLLDNAPFAYWVSIAAEQVRSSRQAEVDTAYAALWDGLGSEEWVYEVEVSDTALDNENKSRYLNSTGQANVWPETGRALSAWHQEGNYGSWAPNKIAGCPAVAIAMLMYDVHNRNGGARVVTSPLFDVSDSEPANSYEVGRKMKIIAGMIPNYKYEAERSSAKTSEIIAGLKAIGFKSAHVEKFNIQRASRALSFTMRSRGTDYPKIGHRGILVCGCEGTSGHIWFCDGYNEQCYTVTRRRRFSKKVVKRWKEYESRFYMNYGWGGFSNGWYEINNVGYSGQFSEKMHMIIGLDYTGSGYGRQQ